MSGELNVQRHIVYVTGQGYQVTANGADSTTIVSNASSNVFGSWVEIMRAQQDLWIVGTIHSHNQTPTGSVEYWEVELGIGEAGSEVTIWQAKTHSLDNEASDSTFAWRMSWWRRFIRLNGGQRIAARLASDDGGMDMRLGLAYVYDTDLKVMK